MTLKELQAIIDAIPTGSECPQAVIVQNRHLLHKIIAMACPVRFTPAPLHLAGLPVIEYRHLPIGAWGFRYHDHLELHVGGDVWAVPVQESKS